MATILITGVNRGIGFELAKHYTARGDVVIGTVRRMSKDSPVHALDGDIEFITADVTDTASLMTAATELKGRRIDTLICNAGMNDGRGALDAASNTSEMWGQLFATNVAGVFFTAQAFAPLVIAAKGKIAIISSRIGILNGGSWVELCLSRVEGGRLKHCRQPGG